MGGLLNCGVPYVVNLMEEYAQWKRLRVFYDKAEEPTLQTLASEKRLITNVTNCKLFFHYCGITWCGSCRGSEKVVPKNAKGEVWPVEKPTLNPTT